MASVAKQATGLKGTPLERVERLRDVIARGASLAEDAFAVDLPLEDVFHERLMDPRHRNAWLSVPLPEVPEVALSSVDTGSADAAAIAQLPPRESPEPLEGLAEVYRAVVLGTRDYVRKNRFESVCSNPDSPPAGYNNAGVLKLDTGKILLNKINPFNAV